MPKLSKCKDCGVKEVPDNLFVTSKEAGKCPDCGERLDFRIKSSVEPAGPNR